MGEYLIARTSTEYEEDVTRNEDGVPINVKIDVVDNFEKREEAEEAMEETYGKGYTIVTHGAAMDL